MLPLNQNNAVLWIALIGIHNKIFGEFWESFKISRGAQLNKEVCSICPLIWMNQFLYIFKKKVISVLLSSKMYHIIHNSFTFSFANGLKKAKFSQISVNSSAQNDLKFYLQTLIFGLPH